MTPIAIAGGTVAAVVAILAIDLFAILLGASFFRARRAAARATAASDAAKGMPEIPVSPLPRRDFLRRTWIASLLVFGAQFGAATLAYLWPSLKGGFGSIIHAGTVGDINSQIQQNGVFYLGVGRFYIVPYSGTGKDAATATNYVAEGVLAQGLMPLYQKCAHLGCRVPFCNSSEWFECPCHGSKYNKAGEYEAGPAPRGMDRFPIKISGSGDGATVTVDTSTVVQGRPRGTDTIHQNPAGPFCV